jgi:hypothetical protein
MNIETLLTGKPLEQSKDFISSLNYEWKELSLEYIIKRHYKGNKNAGKFINILVSNNLVLKKKGIVAGKTVINKSGNKVPIRGCNSYRLPDPILEAKELFGGSNEVQVTTSVLDDEWLNWNPKKIYVETSIEDIDFGEADGIDGLIESIDF